MRRAALLLAVLAMLGGGVYAFVSRALPEASKVQRSARFYTPKEEVWGAILDIATWPSWRTDLTSLEKLPDIRGHAAWRETIAGETVTWETVETLPDRRLVQCVADGDAPYGGCRTWEMVVRDDGAIITLIESIRVKSQTFRWTNSVGTRKKRIDRALDLLGAKFGQVPPKRDQVREISLMDRDNKEAAKAAKAE